MSENIPGMSENSLSQQTRVDSNTAPPIVEPTLQLVALSAGSSLTSGALERDQLIRDLIRINANVNTPPEWRESVKLGVAAFLALGCWSLLGWLLFAQFQYILTISAKIEDPANKDRIVFIKDARDGVNQTSSSIYALLTPIAASITGYFFVSSGSGKVLDRKGIQDLLPPKDGETPLGQTPK